MACGKMIKPLSFEITDGERIATFDKRYGGTYTASTILSTAWQSSDGERAQIFINHTEQDITITVSNGETLTVPALNAKLLKF